MPSKERQQRLKQKERNLQKKSANSSSTQDVSTDQDISHESGPSRDHIIDPHASILHLAGTPRTSSILTDSAAPTTKKGRTRTNTSSVVSQTSNMNISRPSSSLNESDTLSSDSSVFSTGSRGGRPKKRTTRGGRRPGSGRPRTTSRDSSPILYTPQSDRQKRLDLTPIVVSSNVTHTDLISVVDTHQNVQIDLHDSTVVIPQPQPVAPPFVTMTNLEFPDGPTLIWTPDRIATGEIVHPQARVNLQQLWQDNTQWLADDVIDTFLRFLSKMCTNKRVCTLNPAFTNVDLHFGPNPVHFDSVQNCFNHSNDYEILFIPVYFPLHYAIIIVDRTYSPLNPIVTFIDPKPDDNYDRLLPNYPNYHALRLDLIINAIVSLTPGINPQQIRIVSKPRGLYTPQSDGINCGTFVCLYAEAYLFNHANLILPNLNINMERHRIIWHIAQLTKSNTISYFGHNSHILSSVQTIQTVIPPKSTTTTSAKRVEKTLSRTSIVPHVSTPMKNGMAKLPTMPFSPINFASHQDYIATQIDHTGSFVCVTPAHNMDPDPVSDLSKQRSPTPIRRSPRISSRISCRSSSGSSIVSSDSSVKQPKNNPITQRCHFTHPKHIYCADVRAKHIPDYYDSGNPGDAECEYCRALLFTSEVDKTHAINNRVSSGLCCHHGKVVLPPYRDPPQLLRRLALSDTAESKEFRKNQNIYNTLLAFASIQVGQDEATVQGGHLFLLNGEFVRQISSIQPGAHIPSFAQLYILDPQTALDIRKNNPYGGNQVNPTTLRKLDLMIRECHPLTKELSNFHEQYQHALQEYGPDAVQNFRLTLLEERQAPRGIVDPTLHHRQTNIPSDTEALFSIWTESEYPPFQKGIWISTGESELHHIMPHHPMTDSLCYPLLFPSGDDSYHKQIPVSTTFKHRSTQNSQSSDDSLPSDSANDDLDDPSTTDTEDTESDVSDVDSVQNLSTDSADRPRTNHRKFISCRDYVRYRLPFRSGEDYHPIWSAGGGLSQKFVLDYSARIDSDLATYLRRPDLDLRSTLAEDALRWLARNAGLNSTDELGSIVMYRKSHPGTVPHFRDAFYDATTIMARVREPRNAWFFLTFTSNPYWPEITRNLFRKDQKLVDRFDLLCRIYEDKRRHLHYLLDEKNILGKISGYGESREFQKRGGPHLHRVFQSNILALPECIENVIWAHIPPNPPNTDQSSWANFIRRIRELIPKFQIHDCGTHCRNNRGQCSKYFPKPFSNRTILFEDRPALYYRPNPREGGETLTVMKGNVAHIYDNSRIVAYNPLILDMFRCHHNLEYAYGKSTNMKYALKYPFKGPAFSYVKSTNTGKTNVDEPAGYAKMLFRQPAEAYSRLMSYKYVYLSHIVHPLDVHLPGKQRVTIPPGKRQEIMQKLQAGWLPDTKLTHYWKQCATDPEIAQTLFERLPEKYVFKTTHWKKRYFSRNPKKVAKRKPVIGRLYPVSPRDPERFALYLLTKHFPGDDRHLLFGCQTYIEAAKLKGLVEDQEVWVNTLKEAANSLMPNQMRRLFVNILVFGSTENCLIDGKSLWDEFINDFYDSRCPDTQKPARIDRALAIIERLLLDQNRRCSDFGLPTPANSLLDDPDRAVDYFFFPGHLNDDDDETAADTNRFRNVNLNSEQRSFFELILDRVSTPPQDNTDRLFRLSGDGGTGKTFILNYILYQLRSLGKKVLATASTGFASTIFYSGGMTTHSAFRFGIDNQPGKLPSIPLDSFFARRIIEAELIIIDEYTQLNKVVFENIDLLCRQLCSRYANLPFGGKVLITSGDWQQGLPVVLFGNLDAQVAACIQQSNLYPLLRKVHLTQNMRVDPRQLTFLSWLKEIGHGTTGDLVAFPPDMVVDTTKELQEHVFDQGLLQPSHQLLKRLILTPTNRVVDIHNAQLVETLPDVYVDYYSDDKPTEENPLSVNAADYNVDHLYSLTPYGMPAHHLRLKIGCTIVLLVNLDIRSCLCNGTRLVIRKLTPNLIEAEAMTGGSSRSGIVGIPRTRNTFKDPRPDGISFERFQFPVRVAHAMTITKAQGQTVERLGLDFTDEPFAHGQLYTSVSRGTAMEGIRIFAPNKPLDDNGSTLIRNVVAPGIQFD